MRVLVTGATGFLGNYVIAELLKLSGCSIIASSSNSKTARYASWYPSVTYIPFDLSSFDNSTNYFRYFGEPDMILHLAWEGLPNYKESFHLKVNLPRHLAFLFNLIESGIRNVTITGTCLEYGLQEGCLHEEMDVFPSIPYAIAKNELQKSMADMALRYPFELKWLRLFYIYGKGQNPNSLLSQLDIALAKNESTFNMSGGEQVRDFLPVEKAAEYIVKISLQHVITGIINCCSGHPITVKHFVQNYLRSKNMSINLNLGYFPYPDYEPMCFWGDVTKLNKILSNE